MRQRPADPEPVAHLPRPRAVPHHWTDTATRLIGLAAIGLVVILAAAGRTGA